MPELDGKNVRMVIDFLVMPALAKCLKNMFSALLKLEDVLVIMLKQGPG